MNKPVTMYCVNERTREIIPYVMNPDFSTIFPKGIFLTYHDNFVAGFKTQHEAHAWINRVRPPVMTYDDLAKLKGGKYGLERNTALV